MISLNGDKSSVAEFMLNTNHPELLKQYLRNVSYCLSDNLQKKITGMISGASNLNDNPKADLLAYLRFPTDQDRVNP